MESSRLDPWSETSLRTRHQAADRIRERWPTATESRPQRAPDIRRHQGTDLCAPPASAAAGSEGEAKEDVKEGEFSGKQSHYVV